MSRKTQRSRPLGLILAGGKSLRLHPTSLPKPLLKVNGRSLLEESIGKLKGFDVRVLANKAISATIKSAFRRDGLKQPEFFIEPEGRDTAAAIGFGLRSAQNLQPSWVAVLSADQWMEKPAQFKDFLKVVEAEIQLHPEALFVAGSPASTKPEGSHSQFGWIQKRMEGATGSFAVERFVEKPQGDLLSQMRNQGSLINAGMFFGRYETFIRAYQEFYPQVLDKKFPFKNLARQPVDRAIFEKFANVRVIPLPLRWEDLGTWEDWELHISNSNRLKAKKSVDRAYVSPGIPARRVYLSSQALKSVDVFGMDDVAVVERDGRLLVIPLDKCRDLKVFLEKSNHASQ